ncbi:MAG: hypothetical protein ABEJ61_09500 [Haloferacaceae archaeon]
MIELLGIEAIGNVVRAASTVGAVLAEALVLYVAYGLLTRVAEPVVRETIEGV